MAYSTQSRSPVLGQPFVTTGSDLGPYWAKNKVVKIPVLQPGLLFAVGAAIQVVSSSEACSIVVTRRILPGDDTGVVAVGTIVVPNGTAAGKVVYKEITTQNMNAGDELLFTCPDAGGTISWAPWVDCCAREEVKGNNTDFVASA